MAHEETAFAALIDRYCVVSETFLGPIQDIDRFEARSIPTGVGPGRRAPRATLLDALRRAR